MLDNNFDVWVFLWWNRTKAAKLIAFVCCELSRFLLKIEKENKIKLIWIEIIGEFEFGLKSVPYVKFFLFFYSCFVWPEGICMQFYAKTFERKPLLGTKVRIRCLQNCGVHVLWAWPDRINASICVGEIHYLICYTFTYCATHTAQDLKLLLLFLRFLIFSMLLLFHLLLLLLHQHLSSVFVFVNQYTVFIWALCSHIFLCYFNNLLYDCYLLARDSFSTFVRTICFGKRTKASAAAATVAGEMNNDS